MFDYKNWEVDEEKSGFDEDKDAVKWDQVIDFKWLKNEPSPNWKWMTEEEISYLTKVFLPEKQPE